MPERLYGVDYDYNDVPEMKSAEIVRETPKMYYLSKDELHGVGSIFGYRTQIHKEDKEAQITTPEEAIRVARLNLEYGVRYAERGLRKAVEKLDKFDTWAAEYKEEDTEDAPEDS